MDRNILKCEKRGQTILIEAVDSRKENSAPNPKAVLHAANVEEKQTKIGSRTNRHKSVEPDIIQKSDTVVMNTHAFPVFCQHNNHSI
jgi:hypothetical protein